MVSRFELRRDIALLLAMCTAFISACTPDSPQAQPAPRSSVAEQVAPAPPPVPEGDPATATVERASSPRVQGVAQGKFEAGNPVAVATTGAIDIQDNQITGSNGAMFNTERVALVTGDDQYSAGERYADPMMIEPRQAVELRRVIDETRPTQTPDNAFCGAAGTGYLAMARVMEGDTEVIKLIALSGDSIPAASATDVKLCAATNYFSSGK